MDFFIPIEIKSSWLEEAFGSFLSAPQGCLLPCSTEESISLNVKRYLINYPVSMSIGRQYFVFLFHQGTEQPHQGDMNNSTSTNMFLIHKNKF
jgi:hypothetical protein